MTISAAISNHHSSWTHGTGLMDASNMVTHELESYRMCTFSTKEMAFNILGLMYPLPLSTLQVEPIWADLTDGGMDCRVTEQRYLKI